MKHFILPMVTALFLTLPANLMPAFAMGGNDAPSASTAKKDFSDGQKAIKAAKYDQAIVLMKKVVAKEAKNADAHNYLGFAYRKKGNLKSAAHFYNIALKLNPNHKGALEYQGEMFLMQDKLNAAKSNLVRLKKLCPKGCEELEDLEHDVKEYVAANPNRGS